MVEDQGRATRDGRTELNTARIYGTTVRAEEIVRALEDHFRAQEFEVQVYRTTGDRSVFQARKGSLARSCELQ